MRYKRVSNTKVVSGGMMVICSRFPFMNKNKLIVKGSGRIILSYS